MNATPREARLIRLLRLAVVRAEGNPYHDEAGRFTGPGGGHAGKHPRRRLKRKLRKLRNRLQRKHSEMRKRHAEERKTLAATHRQESHDLRQGHEHDRAALRKEQAREARDSHRAEDHEVRQAGRDRAREEAAHKERLAVWEANTRQTLKDPSLSPEHRQHWEDRAREDREYHEAAVASTREAHADRVREVREEHATDRARMADEHPKAHADLAREHARESKALDRRQAREAAKLDARHGREVDRYREHAKGQVAAFKAEHRLGSKREKAGGEPRSLERAMAFSPYRTLKASSAEAILRLCLRKLGLTAAWKRGDVTRADRLALLAAIVDYAHAWLRHEAEATALHHAPRSLERRIKWREEEAGGETVMVMEEAGVRAGIGRFFRRAKNFVRESIVAGVMALRGPAPLTQDDLDAAEQGAQRQEQFFDRFHQEAASPLAPPITPRQFAARAGQYGSAPWQVANSLDRAAAAKAGMKYERWVLGPDENHCPDCPPRAAAGWVPIGTFPDIGAESRCQQNCKCHFSYAVEIPEEKPGPGVKPGYADRLAKRQEREGRQRIQDERRDRKARRKRSLDEGDEP